MKTTVVTGATLLLLVGVVHAQDRVPQGREAQQSTCPEKSLSDLDGKAVTPESLRAEIEALRPAKIAWREIAWKSCLLEGLKESREHAKPVLLWVFIDRPADDARC